MEMCAVWEPKKEGKNVRVGQNMRKRTRENERIGWQCTTISWRAISNLRDQSYSTQWPHPSLPPLSLSLNFYFYFSLSFFLRLSKAKRTSTKMHTNKLCTIDTDVGYREMDSLCFCGGAQSSLRQKPYRWRRALAISFDSKNRIRRQSPKCSFTIFYLFAAVRCQSLLILVFSLFFPHQDLLAGEPFHISPKSIREENRMRSFSIFTNVYSRTLPCAIRTVVVVIVDWQWQNWTKKKEKFLILTTRRHNRKSEDRFEQRHGKTKSL